MLYYGRQNITEEDIEMVADALRGDLITTGPVAEKFEREFASYVGAKHAIAVCNATAALHLCMKVARVTAGDRVVTTPNTFLASANCAAFVGATPDFVDIDPVTYNLCPQSLAENWQSDTKAVVPVHFAGGSADMQAISEIAHENGAVVIEDACHAIGGEMEFEGLYKKIGGHPYADMTTFSFHPVKTMTTGEGGMIVTDNDEYAERARQLRTHGMVRAIDQTVGLEMEGYDERGLWYYEMQELGFNYRITDFQCALGLSQLSRLDDVVRRRREIVSAYNTAFADCEFVETPKLRNNLERDRTSWHLYAVQIDFDQLGITRSQLIEEMREMDVAPHVLYIPVYLQPWYRKTYGYKSGKCPNAERYYQRTLCLPLFPTMTDAEVQQVIDAFLKVTIREPQCVDGNQTGDIPSVAIDPNSSGSTF